MAVKDYREMYISTILTLSKNSGIEANRFSRSYLANLSFDELRLLVNRLQGE